MKPLARFLAAVAVSLWGAASAAPAEAECRPGDGASGTGGQAVVIVAVDRTAARSATFNAGVEAAISTAIRPGTRLILWRFAGRGQPLPQLVLDVVAPALPRADVVDINVLARRMVAAPGHEERMQDCVLARVQDQRRTFLSTLRAELEIFDASPSGASPILLTLGQAVQAVAAEASQGLVDVVLVTDGFEHAAEASFHPVNGRYLTTAEALGRTRTVSPSLRGARVSLAGVGVVSDSPDTVSVTVLTEFWRAILLARGAIPVQITTGPPQQLRR